jgi:hypothetical protein
MSRIHRERPAALSSSWARRPVSYHESGAAHHIDLNHIPAATQRLAAATPDRRPAATMAPNPKER